MIHTGHNHILDRGRNGNGLEIPDQLISTVDLFNDLQLPEGLNELLNEKGYALQPCLGSDPR